MKGWKSSADAPRRRKELPGNRRQEKKKQPRKERQGLSGMKTGMIQGRKERRTADRIGRRETARQTKAEQTAIRTGHSPEAPGQTDRRAAVRIQGDPETTGPRADPAKDRAVPVMAAARGLARALTVMRTAAVLAEIVTVLRENVRRVRDEGRTINSESLLRARALFRKAPLKKGRSTGMKKNAAAARKEINVPKRILSTKRTAQQRTN